MAEGNSYSLIKVDFGGISKPAEILIEKISGAVGGLYKPYQIERVAKAEAKATLIRADTELKITDLHRRAMHRFIEEEAQRQKNIEDITAKALPQLAQESDPSKMENDWITNFFDKARIISDKEMQELWSRVLAGEANFPGTYSKRTVNFLSDLDKSEAQLFSRFCGFVWMFGDLVPLIFDIQAPMYNNYGINFDTINHLETIGLVQFEALTGMNRAKLPKRIGLSYYGQLLVLELPQDSDNLLDIGKAVLTKTGQQLVPVCGSKPVDGFFDYVRAHWKQHEPKPKPVQNDAPQSVSAAAKPTSTPPVAS